MNIFVLDEDPAKAAEYHCDRHVVKMVLESAQMLCNCHRVYGTVHPLMYRATHLVHTCTLWTVTSQANYYWLYRLFGALNNQYRLRFHTVDHKSFADLHCLLSSAPSKQPDLGLTPFAQAMPDHLKQADAVAAYRDYYRKEKAHLHKWTGVKVPEWIF